MKKELDGCQKKEHRKDVDRFMDVKENPQLNKII